MSRFSKFIDHHVTHSSERRAAQEAMNAQISAYQQQTKLMQDEQGRIQGELDEQKRRVNEKQIRSMRSHFRGAGLMDDVSDAPKDKLG